MPKQLLVENRFDFRGGLNTTVSKDLLSVNELVAADNVRLAATPGAIQKRTGTRRMHTTAIGGGTAVTGVIQWDSPSGKQIVAIAGGKLYHKTTELGDFTEVVPPTGSEFSTTTPQSFAVTRAAVAGAPLYLYIADGKMYRWTGSSLLRIDGTNAVPNADLIVSYHTRLFARDIDLKKHLFWSKVGEPEDFTISVNNLPTDGGSALVDVLSGEEIVALALNGSSLIIFTGDSIVRFTGYSTDDIQIAQDTEGISASVGAVGPLAVANVDNLLVALTDRGPYAVSEGGLSPIGQQVEFSFDGLNRAKLNKAAIGYHRGRREVWIAVSGPADAGLNKTVYVYNLRLQSWSGPFTYPFGITCFSRYEDASGDEWLIAGCNDGFVRHMDTGSKDDVLADGTGGVNISMTAELAPIFFSSGPSIVKSLRRAHVQAELTSLTDLRLGISFDGRPFIDYTVQYGGAGLRSHRVDLSGQGYRLSIRLVDNSSDIPVIAGLTIEAHDMGRP